MIKSNSQPGLLNTIKVPRNLLELKKFLPEKKYKKPLCQNENKMPILSKDISMQQLQDEKSKQPSVMLKNPSILVRPESKKSDLKPEPLKRPESKQVLQEKRNVDNLRVIQNPPVGVRARSPEQNVRP